MKKLNKPNQFVHDISTWYKANQRDLPFRRTKDPYRIWISEIMAQQTQMDTVVPYYERFIKRFPTVEALASAPLNEVLSLWEGLGYYRRAKHLHESAQIIATHHQGRFPDTLKEIKALKGVGEYTAAAIHSIAFNQPSPAVDGNVMRVMSRLLGYEKDIRQTQSKQTITDVLKPVMIMGEPTVITQALMELGALVCKKTPLCEECPVNDYCFAYKHNAVAHYPNLSKLKPKTTESYFTFVIYHKNHFLLITRPNDGLLGGLLAFPQTQAKDLKNAINNVQLDDSLTLDNLDYKGKVSHTFTHKIWQMQVYAYESPTILTGMIDIDKKQNALPKAHQKVLELI